MLAGLPDESGWTPLHYAASNGHADIVQLILEHGANSRVPDKTGMTPHMVAAIGGFAKVAEIIGDAAEADDHDQIGKGSARALSQLAVEQCCFNDNVEAKPFLSKSWKDDGFINIAQDLLGMKLEPCCSVASTVGLSRICIEDISISNCFSHCIQ